MTETLLSGWYGCYFKEKDSIVYLIRAFDLSEAVQDLGVIAEGRTVRALMWCELTGITGCAIPTQCRLHEYATGNITIELNGWQVCFWDVKR